MRVTSVMHGKITAKRSSDKELDKGTDRQRVTSRPRQVLHPPLLALVCCLIIVSGLAAQAKPPVRITLPNDNPVRVSPPGDNIKPLTNPPNWTNPLIRQLPEEEIRKGEQLRKQYEKIRGINTIPMMTKKEPTPKPWYDGLLSLFVQGLVLSVAVALCGWGVKKLLMWWFDVSDPIFENRGGLGYTVREETKKPLTGASYLSNSSYSWAPAFFPFLPVPCSHFEIVGPFFLKAESRFIPGTYIPK